MASGIGTGSPHGAELEAAGRHGRLRRDRDADPAAEAESGDRPRADPTTAILVVEDEALNALYISSVLEICGYEVIGVTATAAEAVEAVADRVPDLVLMDITLRGGIDGIAAARSLRERLGVPILFVTAHADAPTLRRARAIDPVGYLIKPFTAHQLEAAVEHALANASAIDTACGSSDDAGQRQDDDDERDDADDPEDVPRH